MAYNVLYYGSGCQGPNDKYHGYLKTIIAHTHPDILSLEKMAAIPISGDDKSGTAPLGFADSILKYALNAAIAGKYAYCPFTNNARANNMSVLFYDTSKLGYVGLVSCYVNSTDFNTYKLYYKDPNLQKHHDTTFLYFTLNHDKSGDEFEGVREQQIAGTLRGLKAHFRHLPNLIDLGDFNVRTSKEGFYQLLTAPADSGFLFYDPPFFPDRKFSYPANWDHEGKFSAYFTTSTRESKSVPNACGSGGGGKNWYDHIFISPWVVNNTNYVHYIPNSYRTIGNDGQRFKVSINNSNAHENIAAPADVIEALFQFSNKYPVMIDLAVTHNTTGVSPADPEIAGVDVLLKDEITVARKVTENQFSVDFPEAYMGQEITFECKDSSGTVAFTQKITVKKQNHSIKCKLAQGKYQLKISGKHNLIKETVIEAE